MKLRLQGNSVRLRLTRSEVERLRETGLVEESIEFGSGELLVYRLQSRREPGSVEATFRAGRDHCDRLTGTPLKPGPAPTKSACMRKAEPSAFRLKRTSAA